MLCMQGIYFYPKRKMFIFFKKKRKIISCFLF